MKNSADNRLVFVTGSVGSGKSTLCKAICKGILEYAHLSLDDQSDFSVHGIDHVPNGKRQEMLRLLQDLEPEIPYEKHRNEPNCYSPYFDEPYFLVEYQEILLKAKYILEHTDKKVLIDCLLRQRKTRDKLWELAQRTIAGVQPKMIQILSADSEIFHQVDKRYSEFDPSSSDYNLQISPRRALEYLRGFEPYDSSLEDWMESCVLQIRWACPEAFLNGNLIPKHTANKNNQAY